MVEDHPDRGILERFLLGRLAVPESGVVVRHLLRGCQLCKESAGALWEVSVGGLRPSGSPPGSWGAAAAELAYDQAVDRAVGLVTELTHSLKSERERAPELCSHLVGLSQHHRLLVVRNSSRYATWGVCERCLSLAWSSRFADPQRTFDLCELAVAISQALDPTAYEARALEDLRARAWASFGNACRMHSDLARAQEAIRAARRHLEAGTGNRLVRATVLDFEATLLSVQGHYENAEHLINESLSIYRRAGQRHLIGQALIRKGMVRGHAGDREGEIIFSREGLGLIDASAEPQLVVAAWHNVLLGMHGLGKHREAQALLAEARPLYAQFASGSSLIRFQWLEGKLAAALGRVEQAEGCLREARRKFIELGFAGEAAFIALDLAGVLARQRRYAEVRELAAEMIAIFRSRQIHTEMIAALLLFQQAAEKERVTTVLLEKVAEQLRQGRERLEPRQGG